MTLKTTRQNVMAGNLILFQPFQYWQLLYATEAEISRASSVMNSNSIITDTSILRKGQYLPERQEFISSLPV